MSRDTCARCPETSHSVVLTAQLLNLALPLEGAAQARDDTDETDPIVSTDALNTAPRILQRQNRLEAQQILELVRSYASGATVQELSRQYEIHRTTVLEHLKRQGVPRQPNVRKLSDADVVEAARLYREGVSTPKLGQQFGVDAETIRRELIRAGVDRRRWT